jgi:hypothetical protein
MFLFTVIPGFTGQHEHAMHTVTKITNEIYKINLIYDILYILPSLLMFEFSDLRLYTV